MKRKIDVIQCHLINLSNCVFNFYCMMTSRRHEEQKRGRRTKSKLFIFHLFVLYNKIFSREQTKMIYAKQRTLLGCDVTQRVVIDSQKFAKVHCWRPHTKIVFGVTAEHFSLLMNLRIQYGSLLGQIIVVKIYEANIRMERHRVRIYYRNLVVCKQA